MPWVVPLIPALIGAGVAGTTTGLEASGAIGGGGGGPSQSTLQQEQLTQEQQAQKQQQQALQQTFRNFAPDAQERFGSGSVTDESFAALINQLSGQPGNIGTAQETIFGTFPQSGLGG